MYIEKTFDEFSYLQGIKIVCLYLPSFHSFSSDKKYSFRRENLVFGVKTGILITKRSFPTNKNRNFNKFFSTKTEVSTVKYYFRYKLLFSTRKPTAMDKNNEKNDKFYQKVAFPMYTEMVILGLKAEKQLRN